MKVTKFVHACILVESDAAVALFDPGVFSWQSGLFKPEDLGRLDYMVITHEHPDHFHLPFVQAVLEKFPDTKIITTDAVMSQLQAAGIKASSQDSGDIKIFSRLPHADLSPLDQTPENIAVHFADQLTVGGDRHDLETSKDILALTLAAPWGSQLEAVRMAIKLKPKIILPVHDWHLNETARAGAYDALEKFFGSLGIRFIKLTDGQPVEL
jgi:L-ascorbate metabolism protein UlaG (beta-lactamase superfamily)